MSASRTTIPRLDDKRRVEVYRHDDGTWHISLWVRRGQFENMFDLPLLTDEERKQLVGKLGD